MPARTAVPTAETGPRSQPPAGHRPAVSANRHALSTYAWSVARTEEPALLIGDAPVLALDGRTRGWHGLVPKGAAVFLPLSSQAVLVGEPHVFKGSSCPSGIAAAVKTLTVREAYQYVFRHPEMVWPVELCLGTQPPSLPRPSLTVRRSDPGQAPTFPYAYRLAAHVPGARVARMPSPPSGQSWLSVLV
jgi:hypothetical protein